MIDGGLGDEGFFFNSTGLQWNETYDGFGGWLGEWFPSSPLKQMSLTMGIKFATGGTGYHSYSGRTYSMRLTSTDIQAAVLRSTSWLWRSREKREKPRYPGMAF